LEEVFYSWCYCQNCSKKETQVILCIKCFKDHIKTCPYKASRFLFYKYNISDLEFFQHRLNERSKLKNQNELLARFTIPQNSLMKVTQDRKTISENKNRKNNLNFDKILSSDYSIFYEKYDPNKISKNILKLINQKYEVCKEQINPLEPEEFLQEMINFGDIMEESNEICFSPINEKQSVEKNSETESLIFPENQERHKIKEEFLHFNTKDYNKNNFKDNYNHNNKKVEAYFYSSNEKEFCFRDDDKSEKNSHIKLNSSNFIRNKNLSNSSFSSDSNINYNSDLKTNNESNTNNFNFSLKSNNLNLNFDLKGNSKPYNFREENCSLINGYALNNTKLNICDNLKFKRASDLFINKGNFEEKNILEQKNNFVKNYFSNDKFGFIIPTEEKSSWKDKIYRALRIVTDLINPQKINNYRIFSDNNFQLNSSIEILKKNLENKELIEELNVNLLKILHFYVKRFNFYLVNRLI